MWSKIVLPDWFHAMSQLPDDRLSALADRLHSASIELRNVPHQPDRSEALSRINSLVGAIVEDLELEWVSTRNEERPPFMGH